MINKERFNLLLNSIGYEWAVFVVIVVISAACFFILLGNSVTFLHKIVNNAPLNYSAIFRNSLWIKFKYIKAYVSDK